MEQPEPKTYHGEEPSEDSQPQHEINNYSEQEEPATMLEETEDSTMEYQQSSSFEENSTKESSKTEEEYQTSSYEDDCNDFSADDVSTPRANSSSDFYHDKLAIQKPKTLIKVGLPSPSRTHPQTTNSIRRESPSFGNSQYKVPSFVPKLSLPPNRSPKASTPIQRYEKYPINQPSVSHSQEIKKSKPIHSTDKPIIDKKERIERNFTASPTFDEPKKTPKTPTRQSLNLLSPKHPLSTGPGAMNSKRRSQSRERISKMFTPPTKGATGAFASMSDFLEVKRTLESMGMSYNGKTVISLESFDEESKEPILLTSPRSIEACLRTGITPLELLKKPESEFTKGVSEEVGKMRWAHYETRRKEKLMMVREERQKIIIEDEDISGVFDFEEERMEDSYRVLIEEQNKVESQFKHNRTYIEHLVQYEIDSKRKLAERENRLKEREERIEKERQKRVERQMEANRKRDQSILERQQELERLRNERKLIELEKQRSVDQKDEKRQQQVEARLRDAKSKTDMLKLKKDDKIKQTQMRDEQNQKLKEQSLLERQEQFEKRMKEFETQKSKILLQTKQRAMSKEKKVKEAQQRGQLNEQEKLNKINEKIMMTEDQLKKFENEKNTLTQRKKIEEQNREFHRLEVIQKNKEETEKKVEKILTRQQKEEQIRKELLEKARRESQRKAEEQRLKDMDKAEVIERTKRVEEFKKLQALAVIEEKNKKVEMIEKGKQELAEKKQLQRTLLERSKYLLKRVNPDSIETAKDVLNKSIDSKSLSSSIDFDQLKLTPRFSTPRGQTQH